MYKYGLEPCKNEHSCCLYKDDQRIKILCSGEFVEMNSLCTLLNEAISYGIINMNKMELLSFQNTLEKN